MPNFFNNKTGTSFPISIFDRRFLRNTFASARPVLEMNTTAPTVGAPVGMGVPVAMGLAVLGAIISGIASAVREQDAEEANAEAAHGCGRGRQRGRGHCEDRA